MTCLSKTSTQSSRPDQSRPLSIAPLINRCYAKRLLRCIPPETRSSMPITCVGGLPGREASMAWGDIALQLKNQSPCSEPAWAHMLWSPGWYLQFIWSWTYWSWWSMRHDGWPQCTKQHRACLALLGTWSLSSFILHWCLRFGRHQGCERSATRMPNGHVRSQCVMACWMMRPSPFNALVRSFLNDKLMVFHNLAELQQVSEMHCFDIAHGYAPPALSSHGYMVSNFCWGSTSTPHFLFYITNGLPAHHCGSDLLLIAHVPPRNKLSWQNSQESKELKSLWPNFFLCWCTAQCSSDLHKRSYNDWEWHLDESAGNCVIRLELWFMLRTANHKSLAILVVLEIGVAILTAIWIDVQITNRAILICDLNLLPQRFGGNSCDLVSAISNVVDVFDIFLWFCSRVGEKEEASRQVAGGGVGFTEHTRGGGGSARPLA